MILRARVVIEHAERVTDGGAVVVRAGRVVRVARSTRAIERAATAGFGPVIDVGEGILSPGLVNAHAHLELGTFAGRMTDRTGFADWIAGVLVAHRASRAGDYERGVSAGVARSLASGTTSIGDIASTREGTRAARRGIRSVVYREVLDAWNPERTDAAMETLRRALPTRRTTREGISPHAPYTTSAELLARVAAVARRRSSNVTIHWSETEAETEWLARGSGPFADILPPSPKAHGLDLVERAGLLRRTTSLVHGNHPERGEPARIARARVSLVHCPGTHAFFDRAPFPWSAYRRAGVTLALGTDSLASNEDLDMRREMRLALQSFPALTPAEAFRMATTNAAIALGLGKIAGALRPGWSADLALFDAPSAAHRDAIQAVIQSSAPVESVWIGGRRVSI